jgi:hypothetical protein
MRRPKYLNRKTVVDGVAFDSRAEARRWHELQLLMRAGEIRALRRQVSFELVPGVRLLGSPRATPAVRYVADFVYTDADGNTVVEDVKGLPTPVYRLKRHLMKHVFNIDIVEIRS